MPSALGVGGTVGTEPRRVRPQGAPGNSRAGECCAGRRQEEAAWDTARRLSDPVFIVDSFVPWPQPEEV